MTAYVVFAALRRRSADQTLPVSLRAWESAKGGGSLMFIEPTTNAEVSDLLRGMIVNSGNDASVVLAEGGAARCHLRRDDEPAGRRPSA